MSSSHSLVDGRSGCRTPVDELEQPISTFSFGRHTATDKKGNGSRGRLSRTVED